jgi:RNA polymerase sigma-70 factor (ECF subfamily)
MQPIPAHVAERVVRESYGRLLAFLAAQVRDVTLAEDALADALTQGLAQWPSRGVPLNPEAWLLTVARRRIVDHARHAQVVEGATERLLMSLEELQKRPEARGEFLDERLKLMYVCAHPAIDEPARAPLMLQTVLGLDAERIASAFVVVPAAMSQRLVRAKSKIRDAGVGFDLPDEDQVSERTTFVLQAIYAAYTLGRDDPHETETSIDGVSSEAIWLARLVVELLPNDPEAMGLLALLLFCESRRSASRADESKVFVPLSEQDCSHWSEPLMSEAEIWLRRAGGMNNHGRFQLEAAIQAVHADRRRTKKTDWQAIRTLYDGLVTRAPSIGAFVSRAAAISEMEGAAAGLRELDQFNAKDVIGYQPYWAVRATLLADCRETEAALIAYTAAIRLCSDPVISTYLQSKEIELRTQTISKSRDLVRHCAGDQRATD